MGDVAKDANLPLKLQNRLLQNRAISSIQILFTRRLSLLCFGTLSNKAARCLSIRAQRTSGSVDLKGERMGTSFVFVENLGSDIILELTAPVGGPLATLRAEAFGSACCHE